MGTSRPPIRNACTNLAGTVAFPCIISHHHIISCDSALYDTILSYISLYCVVLYHALLHYIMILCLYIYIYTCIYTYVHTYTHIYIYIFLCEGYIICQCIDMGCLLQLSRRLCWKLFKAQAQASPLTLYTGHPGCNTTADVRKPDSTATAAPNQPPSGFASCGTKSLAASVILFCMRTTQTRNLNPKAQKASLSRAMPSRVLAG